MKISTKDPETLLACSKEGGRMSPRPSETVREIRDSVKQDAIRQIERGGSFGRPAPSTDADRDRSQIQKDAERELIKHVEKWVP
jgi:hypothetical protein